MSSKTQEKNSRRKLLSAEAKRVLSLLDAGPPLNNGITRDENGRPFFSDRHADFSISHSGEMAAVSLVSGGNLKTGCDIEYAAPRTNAKEIAERYFSTREAAWIFPPEGNSESPMDFFKIWTLKECYLKLRGFSVFDMQKAPSFIDDEGRFAFCREVSSPLSFYVYRLEGSSGEVYILSAAIEGDEQVQPGIRWFSQSFFTASSIVEIKAAPSPTMTVSPKM